MKINKLFDHVPPPPVKTLAAVELQLTPQDWHDLKVIVAAAKANDHSIRAEARQTGEGQTYDVYGVMDRIQSA